MVLQAQVSVLIDDGNSVKFCKNEEFELSVNYTMFKEKHSRHMFFYFIAIETFFFQVFHLATSCSFIFLQYYFILLYHAIPLPVSESPTTNTTPHISKHKQSRKNPYKYPQKIQCQCADSPPLLPIGNASKMDT
jgi:hypothetical protein